MFITHQLTPGEMLSELLNLKGYEKVDTERFFKLGHDSHLCPEFRERVSAMLDAYKSHRTDVQDTQGPRDEGIDVDLRYQQEGTHHVGLQIKSYKEIEDWAAKREPHFMLKLKAQISAALHNVGVEDFYLLLCTDEIAHKKQIRLICSELKQFERVRIVLPRQALAFYERDDDWISTFVTKMLCKDDAVLDAALRHAGRMDPDHAFIQLSLLCRACEGAGKISQEDLFEIHHEWLELIGEEDLGSDRLADLIGELDGNGYCYGSDGEDSLSLPDFPTSWVALYFDQKQRRGGDVQARLAMLFGITPETPLRSPRQRRGRPKA